MDADRLARKRIARNFTRAAYRYDDHAALQQNVGRELIQLVSLDASKTCFVLDVGCGTGFCVEQLNKRAQNRIYFALDFSFDMLKLAKNRSSKTAAWFCGDALSMPFAARKFDLVISNLAFQWCNPLDSVLQEAFRVLKPGGMLAFTTFGEDTLKELRTAWSRVDHNRHVNNFLSTKDIECNLKATGFTEYVVRSKIHRVKYADVVTLMRELKAIGAQFVIDARRGGLTGKEKFNRMMTEYTPTESDKSITASFQVIYATAITKKG